MFSEAQIAPYQPPTFTLDQVDQPHTPEQEMQMLGISSENELQRYQKVSEIAGHGIALAEIERNKRAYEREFLQDIPVAEPHSYFHISGELYSEEINHPLFRVASQTDPREREGRTLEGFMRFQNEIMQAADGEVIMWYSPAGFAGIEEPFSNIYFDSGRLYLAFKDSAYQSTHIDIKISENHFPITELLKQYGDCSLDRPVNTKQDSQNFFISLYDFVDTHDGGNTVYTSKRESKYKTEHTLQQIVKQITRQISLYQNIPHIPAESAFYPQQQPTMTKKDIKDMYLEVIINHMEQNGGEDPMLYGCSTTSVIKAAQEAGQSTGFAGLGSPFSSFARVMSGSSTKKEGEEVCVKCPECGNKDKNKQLKDGSYVCGSPRCKTNN